VGDSDGEDEFVGHGLWNSYLNTLDTFLVT
jgi:hypothetical protein